MNVNVAPKDAVVAPPKLARVKFIKDWHRTAEPMRGRLEVFLDADEATPPFSVTVTGDDYARLGQWTDAGLQSYLIQRLGLTIAP